MRAATIVVIAGVAFSVVVLLSLVCFHRPDPRLAEIRQLREQLDAEKVDLDRMQRSVAAYDALNKTVEDQIRYLETQGNPQ
jgi:hypothetical protein